MKGGERKEKETKEADGRFGGTLEQMGGEQVQRGRPRCYTRLPGLSESRVSPGLQAVSPVAGEPGVTLACDDFLLKIFCVNGDCCALRGRVAGAAQHNYATALCKTKRGVAILPQIPRYVLTSHSVLLLRWIPTLDEVRWSKLLGVKL